MLGYGLWTRARWLSSLLAEQMSEEFADRIERELDRGLKRELTRHVERNEPLSDDQRQRLNWDVNAECEELVARRTTMV